MINDIINNIHKLSSEELSDFHQILVLKKYKKKEILLREGNTCKGIYFVKNGIIGLCQEKNGIDIYQDFFLKFQFATNILSLSKQTPSQHNLVALEESTVLFLSRDKMLELYKTSTNFQEFGRKFLEKLLVEKTEINHIHTLMSSKEKYNYIVNNRPDLLQNIPLQYLSTFLGMTRETLSRIRKTK